MTSAPLTVVVIEGIVTVNGVVGVEYKAFDAATSISHDDAVPPSGRKTSIRTILFTVDPIVTEGFADHVPLNTHQNARVRQRAAEALT
jgi:hypothetical protein